jgi:uncharacterized RDD family membrane protein YckC
MDKHVGFGPRLAAALIDLLVVGIVAIVAGAALGGLLGRGIGGALDGSAAAGPASGAAMGAAVGAALGAVAAFGAFLFLYSLIEALTGASPGKRALGLKVGLEPGREAPVGVYLRRWAVKFSGTLLGLAGAVPGLHAIGLLAPVAGLVVFIGCFLVLGDKRQALHDLAAGTAVFRRADLAA